MDIKVGDKVRFLNAIGGGQVLRFLPNGMALVLEEDGFETPVLMRECVVIEQAKDTPKTESNSYESKKVSSTSKQFAVEESEKEDEEVFETPEGENITFYLAYLPKDIKNLQKCGYDVYLLNDSNYFISVNIMSKTEKGWISRFNGTIEPNIKLYIEEIEKEQLNDLERLTVQLFAFKKEKPFVQKNCYSINYKIDPVKFYKLHSFRENDFFEEDALLFPLVEKDVPYQMFDLSQEEIAAAVKMKEAKPIRQRIEKKVKEKPILEIDLHINELLDNTSGLSNADMLNYQMDKFKEVMNEYAQAKGKKIVFIHGKGEGVLRKEILNELKLKHKSCIVQDASFKEYGFGATMVTIR